MRNRGFTLIELLVVIAIIAILGAIVFPVFVRAKESVSRHMAMGNCKQVGLSILAYASDSEESLPLSMPASLEGRLLPTEPIAVPSGWDGYPATDSIAWPNSTQPYRKDTKLLAAHGLPEVEAPGFNYGRPLRETANVNLTYNGLLHSLPVSGIASPSRLTMLWQGEMKVNSKGYTRSRPLLLCNGMPSSPCMFDPEHPPQEGSSLGSGGRADALYKPFSPASDTVWVYGRGMNFVAIDNSAHFRELGTSLRMASYSDPGASYDATGKLLSIHRCRTTSSAPFYSSFFRPDTAFDFPFGEQAASCSN